MFLFDIDKLKENLKELENKINEPNFWNDQAKANKITTDMKRIERKIKYFSDIEKELKNIDELNEMLLKEYDSETAIEILKETKK